MSRAYAAQKLSSLSKTLELEFHQVPVCFRFPNQLVFLEDPERHRIVTLDYVDDNSRNDPQNRDPRSDEIGLLLLHYDLLALFNSESRFQNFIYIINFKTGGIVHTLDTKMCVISLQYTEPPDHVLIAYGTQSINGISTSVIIKWTLQDFKEISRWTLPVKHHDVLCDLTNVYFYLDQTIIYTELESVPDLESIDTASSYPKNPVARAIQMKLYIIIP